MEELPIYQEFEKLIETKINRRNAEAQKRPRPDGLISYYDREIDILERIANHIIILEQTHQKNIIRSTMQAFYKGVQSGILEAKTGRSHPMHLMST